MSDKDWQAESDFRALVEADRIKKDPKRLAAAKKCAEKRVTESKQEAATVAKL